MNNTIFTIKTTMQNGTQKEISLHGYDVFEAQKIAQKLSEKYGIVNVIAFYPDEDMSVVSKWIYGQRMELIPIWSSVEEGEIL